MISWLTFYYAAGPILIFTLIFSFAPYFFYSSRWIDAVSSDPIKIGLQSLSYRYALVAGVAASIPPIAELSIDVLFSRHKSNKSSRIIILILFCVVMPELISLIFISPHSNSKLFICLQSAKLNVGAFAASILLCQFGKNFWTTKLFTVALSFHYLGVTTVANASYFSNFTGDCIQYVGLLLIIIGSILFMLLSYKFFFRKAIIENTDDCTLVDDFFCRFTVICMVFVTVCMIILNFGMRIHNWKEANSTYLTCLTCILSGPNIAMCVAFSHATRNEASYVQKVKQMFVRYISHEMRTPLNTAVMGLQYLRSELMKRNSNDNLIEILDEVQGSCEISVNILNEMLDYDKLQSGVMKLELEEVPVLDFLNTTLSPFYIQASQKSVILTSHLDHCILPQLIVTADRHKLAQVIRNLVSNALKFTPAGGTVDVVAVIVPEEEGQPPPLPQRTAPSIASATGSTHSITYYKLQINVTDTGVGVSKVNQEKLFKEIVQFSPGKLQSGGGSGLGLYISKSIMDLHGWSMTIASEGEGYGSTFSIILNSKAYLSATDIADIDTAAISRNSNFTSNSLPNNSTKRRDKSIKLLRPVSSKIVPDTYINNDVNISAAPLTPISPHGHHHLDFRDLERQVINRNKRLLNVLVVDDSVSNRKMLIRLLREKCSSIVEADNGLEATEKVKATLITTTAMTMTTATSTNRCDDVFFDAVLIDYIMPVMEGPEAAQYMRDFGYRGLIIGITGNVLPVDKERFRNLGANIVLTKPVNICDIEKAFLLLDG